MTTIDMQTPKKKSKFEKLFTTRKGKRALFVLAIMLPFLIWMMIYMFIPLLSVFVYSFTDAKLAYDTFSFQQFYQFEKLFSNPTAVNSIVNTFKAAFIIMPIAFVLSLLTALGLNVLTDRIREFYTFIYFLPSIVSMTAVCLVWNWIYHEQYGLLNSIILSFGGTKVLFLKSQAIALFFLCVIDIWSIFGYYAVIIFANLRGIDPSLYEAAELDGANSINKFFHVTVPMLKNTLIFVAVMLTTHAFMFVTPSLLLTDGTPGTSTMTLLLYIYKQGITQGNIAYSSALSLILMIIILLVSLLQMYLTREKTVKPRRVKL